MRLVLFLLLLLPVQTVCAQELKELFNEKAVQFVYANQYDSAVVYFSKVIQLSPNDEIAYLDRGLAYEKLHHFYEAIADFAKQQEIDSTMPDASFLKGILMEQLGDTTAALKEYLNVTQLDFYNSDAHFYAGRCAEKMNNLVLADSCYSRALQGNPFNLKVLPFHILCRLKEKNKPGIDELIAKIPADYEVPNVSFSLGAAAYFSQKYVEANAHFRKAIELDYFSDWTLLQRSPFAFTNKQFVKLLKKDWQKSEDVNNRLMVIQTAMITGNWKFAEKYLETIRENSSVDFYRLNAIMYMYNGDWENSLEWLKKVVSVQHIGNDEYLIAIVYSHLAQPEKACEWYHSYLNQASVPMAYPLYNYCHPTHE